MKQTIKMQEQLKLQAAMEGTSHPAPPSGGFRKTGNGEQYAFKKGKYRGMCHSHLYVSNLLPAGGAMSITEH